MSQRLVLRSAPASDMSSSSSAAAAATTETAAASSNEPMFVSGSNVPDEGNRYVVFVCEDGHKTPVYCYPLEQTQIRQPGRCQFSVRNIAKEKIDIGIAHIDRPVAVWFAGRENSLPWMSMLKACDKCFVDYESVPEAQLEVDFVEKPAIKDGAEVQL